MATAKQAFSATAFVLSLLSVGVAQPVAAQRCGNGIIEPPETCDDGGYCVGGANAGTACTADTGCAGGACQPAGGDGCAANCTAESRIAFALVPGQLDGNAVALGTSGLALAGESLTLPSPMSGRVILTVGTQRNGQIPVVIRAGDLQIPAIAVAALSPCFCLRGVAAKTCGGTAFDIDGTPATDCTEGYTAGASLCPPQQPCAFIHGPDNAASGVVSCSGLDHTDVDVTEECHVPGLPLSEPVVTLHGSGGPGSAVLQWSTALGDGGTLACRGDSPNTGPDGVFCTDDDPQDARGVPLTQVLTTGTVGGRIIEADGVGGVIGPFGLEGVPFNCCAGGLGSVDGVRVVGVSTACDQPALRDAVITAALQGDRSPCHGDCNGDHTVTVDELLRLVRVGLGDAPVLDCVNGDADADNAITIDEIITAVTRALDGCRIASTRGLR